MFRASSMARVRYKFPCGPLKVAEATVIMCEKFGACGGQIDQGIPHILIYPPYLVISCHIRARIWRKKSARGGTYITVLEYSNQTSIRWAPLLYTQALTVTTD